MYVSGGTGDTYLYASFRELSGLGAIWVGLKAYRTLPFRESNIRYAIRELYRGHCGQDGKGRLAPSFHSMHPIHSVNAFTHARTHGKNRQNLAVTSRIFSSLTAFPERCHSTLQADAIRVKSCIELVLAVVR